MSADSRWRFFIDRGGTFTDIVAIDPAGRLHTRKLLSDNPRQYADAAVTGIGQLLADWQGTAEIDVRIGTTVGTNALLERRGAPTALVITAGFADLLQIGSQQRPDIFALDIQLPTMLYKTVLEADERISADGSVLRPLDEASLRAQLESARKRGIESIAVALLNSYQNPDHENAAARIARECGFDYVSLSSAISPAIRLLDRGDTAVVDAYLNPVLDDYKSRLRAGLSTVDADAQLLFMQSHGGLALADEFRGADCILSGPAGGVVGMVATAAEAGFGNVVGFDMGGTSTDVSLYAGSFERTASELIAGCRVVRPMLRINTVAAGGGSILHYSNERLQVGPASAGSNPGPACYRNGGPLTLTDANVLLGRIQPDLFPSVFGPQADQPIDTAVVADAFESLRADIASGGGPDMSGEALAAGFVSIAIANMAQAIEQISIQRGHDIREFALSCFGGAGGQHACLLADALGMRSVLIDPLSGVLSAYGIGIAEQRSIAAAGIHAVLDDTSLASAVAAAGKLADSLQRDNDTDCRFKWRAFLRLDGSDTLLDVSLNTDSTCNSLAAAFTNAHQRHFGFAGADSKLVLQSIEVEAIRPGADVVRHELRGTEQTAEPQLRRPVWFEGRQHQTPVWQRRQLAPGTRISGPALIVEDNATIVIEPGWAAQPDPGGMLHLTREQELDDRRDTATRCDPVTLEIFNNRFMHIAEQMGAVLEQTAYSVNIKERLDYSCALFDDAGRLIANAPHVPVHLGSMGDSVRAIIRKAGKFSPGDAWILNAPYVGGTHLPDITVVTPVFASKPAAGDGKPAFFVASRAHHADIGGITPGSMPALSRSIDEEGIVIEPTQLVAAGQLLEQQLRSLLGSGHWPARSPDHNLADIRAQLAANATGVAAIDRMIAQSGTEVVRAYMTHVRSNAASCTRQALTTLASGEFTVQSDDGGDIAVRVSIDHDDATARIDFSGTSGLTDSNLNAPRSVVRAVVLYALRTRVADKIPLNDGCLDPIELVIPEATRLSPVYPAAVAGGNVETSQLIADALLAALDAVAASQGTMNNLTFGDDRHQYYETICGGCGAGPGFNGASAVHSHMTNSRLTDVEILEQRFPVRLVRFGIRPNSGGRGRWHGGDGVIREIEFLAPMKLSLLTGRRRIAPFGLAGGEPGLPGINTLIRADGTTETLPGAAEIEVNAGDRILIATPGGGGYGSVDPG